MVYNDGTDSQHKREASPDGLEPKSIQQIREETEKKQRVTQQEIDDRLCNLEAEKEFDQHIEQLE
ncbi:MAG TPA: hypothetical protein V6C91_10515 [Coleofasciculaceae cyanobacterium]